MSPQVTTTVRNTTLLCKDNLCGWDGSWLPDSSQPSLAAHGSSPPAGGGRQLLVFHTPCIGDAALLLAVRHTGEAPPERRTIYFIFTDPVLGSIEGVTVLSNSDLKQDARSCVRSVKIQKLYQSFMFFFLLYAAWVRSRAERPSVSYTRVVMEVAWTGHNLQLQRRIKQQNCGSNKFLHRGGREDETDARAEHQTHWLGASNEWMMEPR